VFNGNRGGIKYGDICLDRETLKFGMSGTLTDSLVVTLGSFNVALQDTDLVALPVQLEYVFFMSFNRVQQLLLLRWPTS
jgi:hypothetical protein